MEAAEIASFTALLLPTLPAPLPCACRSVRTPEITAEREAGGETAADELACMRTCVFEVRTSARICSIPSPPPWLDSDAPPAAATALFLSLLRLSQFIDAAVPPQHGGAAAQLLKLLPALLCCCAGAVLPRRMLATGAAALPRRRDPSRVIPARVIMKDPSRVSPARVGVGGVRIVRHTTDGSRALSSTPEAARQPAPLTPPRASGRSGLPGQAIARAKRTGGPSGAWASRRGIASSSSEETGPRGTLNRRRAHQWVFPSEPIARLGAHRLIRNHPFSPTIPASFFSTYLQTT